MYNNNNNNTNNNKKKKKNKKKNIKHEEDKKTTRNMTKIKGKKAVFKNVSKSLGQTSSGLYKK